MDTKVSPSHVDALKLEHDQLQFEVDTLKKMLRLLNEAIHEGKKLISTGQVAAPQGSTPAPAPRVTTPSFFWRLLQALPGGMRDRLRQKSLACRTQDGRAIVLADTIAGLQKQLVSLKMCVAVAIADRKKAERQLHAAGIQGVPT